MSVKLEIVTGEYNALIREEQTTSIQICLRQLREKAYAIGKSLAKSQILSKMEREVMNQIHHERQREARNAVRREMNKRAAMTMTAKLEGKPVPVFKTVLEKVDPTPEPKLCNDDENPMFYFIKHGFDSNYPRKG